MAVKELKLELELLKDPTGESAGFKVAQAAVTSATNAAQSARKILENLNAPAAPPRIALLDSPIPFEESWMSFGDALIHYVDTPLREMVVEVVQKTMAKSEEREMCFPIITGMMGVGKTRFAQEVCKDLKGPNVIVGYIGDAGDLAGEGEKNLASERLAQALLMAFWRRIPAPNEVSYDLKSVIDKFRRDFKNPNVSVVLHIDEYSRNVPGLNLVLLGCVKAAITHHFHVVPVFTGVKPLTADLVPQKFGSQFSFDRHTLSPLVADSLEMRVRFKEALRVHEGVELCQDLIMLLQACGGYPASIVATLQVLRSLSEPVRKHMLSHGILPVDQVQAVYSKVVANLEQRYSETRWMEVLKNLVPDKTGEKVLRLTDRSRDLLRRVLLVALVDAAVKRSDVVFQPASETTYDNLEGCGLVTLLPVDGSPSAVTVTLPLLAMTAMNRFLTVVDLDVLDSPFATGFVAHEKLSMVSLATRLRVLAALKAPGSTCTLAELRPGSLIVFKKGKGDLVITLPANVNLLQVGALVKSGSLVTGANALGHPLPTDDGTLWLAALNEQGLDSGVLLCGKLGGKDVLVFIESQSKSLNATTAIDGSFVSNGMVKTVLNDMEAVRSDWVKTWLVERSKKDDKPVVVVRDVFTDRKTGPQFKKNGVGLPDVPTAKGEGETVAVVFTSRDEMPTAIGSVLSMRAALKRPAAGAPAGVAQEKKAKARRGRF